MHNTPKHGKPGLSPVPGSGFRVPGSGLDHNAEFGSRNQKPMSREHFARTGQELGAPRRVETLGMRDSSYRPWNRSRESGHRFLGFSQRGEAATKSEAALNHREAADTERHPPTFLGGRRFSVVQLPWRIPRRARGFGWIVVQRALNKKRISLRSVRSVRLKSLRGLRKLSQIVVRSQSVPIRGIRFPTESSQVKPCQAKSNRVQPSRRSGRMGTSSSPSN